LAFSPARRLRVVALAAVLVAVARLRQELRLCQVHLRYPVDRQRQLRRVKVGERVALPRLEPEEPHRWT